MPLELGVGEACSERWRRLFRPFTNADTPAVVSVRDEIARLTAARRNNVYSASATNNPQLDEQFVHSAASVSGAKSKRCLYFLHLDGRPVESQSVAVDGSSASTGALPTPIGCSPPERCRAELRVGDWVTARSRAKVVFVKVLDIDLLTPSVTVAAPMPGASYGDMDNARAEVWDDLGRLWGAWVWRTVPTKASNAAIKAESAEGSQTMLGKLWQLPASDSEAGLEELKRLVKDDEAEKAAEEAGSASRKAAQAQELTNNMQTYYSQQTIQRIKDVSGPAPKVI